MGADGNYIVLVNGATIPYVEVSMEFPIGRKVYLKCLDLAKKLQRINVDSYEIICLKSLLLFDSG